MQKPLKLITLKQLVTLCFKNPKLFAKICKNAASALAAVGCYLAPADLALLNARIADLTPHELELIQWVFDNLAQSRNKYNPKKPPLWP
ncbi:MAG: hypothetical protein IPP94_04895 [Ignavibacteria bacterium]|nr:hypothetical protein [Ignavibacteria bacterium]